MRAVCQRVTRASVSIAGTERAAIAHGLVILVGIAGDDADASAARLAQKVARLRVFEDERGKFDRSLVDVGGSALVISQFTLIADTSKGNRPSFAEAAPPDRAEPIYERFCDALREHGVSVETGEFGARMEVALVNDGPVTIVLDV